MRARRFRAPGRINLIGEHTDYNEGFVMPAAIDLATWTEAAPRNDRSVVVRSHTFAGEEFAFSLDEDAAGAAAVAARATRGVAWPDYVRGVALVLEQSGYRLQGADLTIRSTVPLGAGLSSSAAIEVSVALALLGLAGHAPDRLAIARMAQRAEHEYAGTRCGLMDQFACCFGEAERAMLLDCRTLVYRAVPLPPGTCLIVANTMVKRDLASGEYNARRADCEEAALRLGVRSLRDADLAALDRAGLPDRMHRRARHVVTENARALAAAQALEQGGLEEFGLLMAASHGSLRDDFEVSCGELDAMVNATAPLPGVYGSRMMGGGFGGCTITLARAEAAGDLMSAIAARYREATGIDARLYQCRAVAGAGEELEGREGMPLA